MINTNYQNRNLPPVTQTNKNSLSQLQQPQTGTNSTSAFASVISQLITEMEMQSSSSDSSSSIGSFLPELAMLMNPTMFSSLSGMDPTTSTIDPYNLTSTSVDSTVPDQMDTIGTTENFGDSQVAPLSFQTVSPDALNKVLGGKLTGMGEAFVRAGQQYNVNPALLTAIAQHETGNGTSPAAYQRNNIAGMMGTNGLKSYPNIVASINDMASNLSKNYLGQGLTSIEKIGAKYAPVGAQNDPTGLNNNWVKGVSSFFDGLIV